MNLVGAVRPKAHLILGGIRFVNGTAALLAPSFTAGRLGVDSDANPAPHYPLRMFGVRTMVLGAELLTGDEATRERSMRIGIVIHASDTAAAAIGGLRRELPPSVAGPLVAVSAVNTCLAVIGSLPPGRSKWRRLIKR